MKSRSGFIGLALAVGAALPVLAARSADAAGSSAEYPPHAAPITAIRAAAQDTAAGRAIFTGKGACFACHGPDARGTPLAPNLTDSTWLHIDGSLDAIVKLVTEGVPKPKQAPAPMPPRGGAPLTDAEVRTVASYVFSLSHPAK